MSANKWFVLFKDKRLGPFDEAQLKTLVQRGKIDRSTTLIGGDRDPFPAGTIRELFPAPDNPKNAGVDWDENVLSDVETIDGDSVDEGFFDVDIPDVEVIEDTSVSQIVNAPIGTASFANAQSRRPPVMKPSRLSPALISTIAALGLVLIVGVYYGVAAVYRHHAPVTKQTAKSDDESLASLDVLIDEREDLTTRQPLEEKRFDATASDSTRGEAGESVEPGEPEKQDALATTEHETQEQGAAMKVPVGDEAIAAVAEATAGDTSDRKQIARTWKTKAGASFSAAVVAIEKDNVVFKRSESGSEIAMPIGNLGSDDEVILRVAYFGEQDKIQIERAGSLITRIGSQPQESADVFKQSHIDAPESPYGGLWAAVCLSAGANKNEEATFILRQVIARIERQREFDRSRHSMTLTSALNNMAICMLKDHKANAAAGLLSRGLQLMPKPSPIVIRNARQLLEIGKLPNTPLELASSSRKRLEDSLSNLPPEKDKLPLGWLYSLDVDLPRLQVGGNQIVGIAPPRPGFYPSHTTTGLAISSDSVIASASVLGFQDIAASAKVTVVSIQQDDQLRSSDARIVKANEDTTLIAIRCSDLKLSSVTLNASPAVSGNDIAVYSFRLQDDRLDATSLKATLGKLQPSSTDSPYQQLALGLSGDGPVVSRQGQVIGFAHRDKARNATIMTSAEKLVNFAREVTGERDASIGAVGFEQVRAACVFVVRWQGPDATEKLYLSQISSVSSGVTSLSVRDPWCVACKGVGFIDCVNGNCQKGVVVVKRRAQVGVNGLTGEPIFGNKNFKERCLECSGRGGFDCKHCNGGKLYP